ncbi:MAG: addiction module toxin, HicA family [Betaproteobacteria bacterium]|nr:addiction module toxin, HicA family [Betaproteobacteria bacterium]
MSISHPTVHGCGLLRKGGNHSWWRHSITNKRSAIPGHTEINNLLAGKICRAPGIPEPEKF